MMIYFWNKIEISTVKQKSCLVLAGLFLFSALAPAYAEGKKFESSQNSSSYHLRARLQSMEEASPLEKAKFRSTINALKGNKEEEKEALLLQNHLQKKYEITQRGFQQILTLTKQTFFKFSSIKITHSLQMSQVLYESIAIIAYFTFSYLAESYLTLDSFSLKILLLLISVSIPIVLGESAFKLHPAWKKELRTFSQILINGLAKYSFWEMRSWIKAKITRQSYLKTRSEMTHVLQKRNEFGVAVRYIGSWDIRKKDKKVLGSKTSKEQWIITRVSEDNEWGEEINPEKERNLNTVLQEVLKNYPQSRDFRIVIAEGYSPLGSMDLNKGILYLDSSALDSKELAMVGLDHELYHWNNPSASEENAIERTKAFILSLTETKKESTLKTIADLYGEEAKDEILGNLPSAQISKAMEERRMSQLGIRGRVEYFRKKQENYWIVMDGDVEFKLSETPKKPSEYNAIQKWTDEGLDIIKEMLRARALREHVLLVGEAGVGKDWLALVYGELMGEEPIVMSLSEEIEGQDLVAWRGLEKSLTIWEYSQIVKAYKEGKIIIIDEVTKTRPGARAILNDLMQSKEIELPDGKRVKRGEGFQIIATMNEAKEPYGGYELGEDFEDRFGAILEVRELPKEKRVEFLKRTTAVIPAKAGIQKIGSAELLDSRLRGNDVKIPEEFIRELVEMQERINTSGKVWRKMSLRVLERIIEAIQKYPDEDIGEIIRAEYRIGDWEGGREFVEKEIDKLMKKEWEKDWKNGTPLRGPTENVRGIQFSPDGSSLVSRAEGGEVFHWRVNKDGTVSPQGTRLIGPTQIVRGIQFSPDGSSLVSGGEGGEVFHWRVNEDGTVSPQGTRLIGPTENVLDIQFSPDGRSLVSGGNGGEIFHWRVNKDGTVSPQGTRLIGPTQYVWGIQFSPDGRSLVSRGEGRKVFHWRVNKDGTVSPQGTRLIGPTENVLDIQFSPDGRSLVSGGLGGEVFWWKLPQAKNKVLERAKAEAGSTPTHAIPQAIGSELVSGDVHLPLGTDTEYPSSEYEYSPKETPTNNKIIHQILLGISLGRNVLVIGPVGTGKSWLTKAVFRMLRRKVEHMSLHEGTTTRDLTCWPKTKSENNQDGYHSISTDYELSPLARAMLEGRPFIADEVNRATPGVLAVLNHALQFKELILPREIELTLPDGRKILTNRIKAKQGFSLVMTMNPPGGRVEVNDMMADFMDRMYVVEVGYLPELEERAWLEKIWEENGKVLNQTPENVLDEQTKKEIEELVKIANNSRALAKENKDRAISTRTLERMIRFKKENPEDSWVNILCMMSGVEGAVSHEKRNALETYWEGKFGKGKEQRAPPTPIKIEISKNKKEVKIGKYSWRRKDSNILTHYFKGIEENDRILEVMSKMRRLGEHVLLVGEAGVGKDWLALVYGELMGEEPIVMSLSEEIEGQDLVAWRGLEKSLTIWEYSQIVKAYREGTIIIIDEVTKTRPGARAILNDLMQSKEIELPDGQRVKRGEGFQIIATMNEAKEPYGGYELGEDFEDRFGAILEVRELPKEKRVEFLKRTTAVIPAKAGIQKIGSAELLDSRLRGNDVKIPEEFIRELVEMQERINTSGKVWRKMSLRVLERIIETIQKYPDEDIGEIIRAEYRIGEWEGGREFVEKEIQALTKKEWLPDEDLKDMRKLEGPNKTLGALIYSPNGKQMISGFDYTSGIWVWDVGQNGKIIENSGRELKIGLEWPRTVSIIEIVYSPNGKQMISGGYINNSDYKSEDYKGGVVMVWDVGEDGKLIENSGRRLEIGTFRAVTSFIYSPSSKEMICICSGDGASDVFIFNIGEDGKLIENSGRKLEIPNEDNVSEIIYLSNGKQIIAGGSKGGFIWDVGEDGRIIENSGRKLEGPTMSAINLNNSPNGKQLIYFGQMTHSLYIWDVGEDGKLIENSGRKLEGPSYKVLRLNIYSPDNKQLITSGFNPVEEVYIWDVGKDGKIIENSGRRLKGPKPYAKSLLYSPNRKQFISGAESIYSWEIGEDGKIIENSRRKLKGPSTRGLQKLGYSSNGKHLITSYFTQFAGYSESELYFWDVGEDGKIIENSGKGFEWNGDIRFVCSPEGRQILLGNNEVNGVYILDIPRRRGSLIERALSESDKFIKKSYSPPQIIGDELTNGDVRIPIGSDTNYPGVEYEYSPKETPTNNKIIHQILLGISLGRNVLVIGPVGTGKSWLTKAVFRMLHKKVEHMSLHEGTTTRDLTCWPKTKQEKSGESVSISTDYELSPLARAMLEGRPFIADEVNRATPGVLAVLNHALQFKELILPREIELTLPDGRKIITNRIKAKQGFSLVMTMNPPGGRVEVNDMMADFMDRMYGVEVGYLPEEEEVSWLEKIWKENGKVLNQTPENVLDEQTKKEIKELVKIANNSRELAKENKDRAISTRTLERIIRFKKENPEDSWVNILSMMSGVEGAVSHEKRNALETYWQGKFGKGKKQRAPPTPIKIEVSKDKKEVKIGKYSWRRKDSNILTHYFKGIEENDRILEVISKMRRLGEHVLLVGEAGVGKDWLALVYGELMGEEPIVMSLSEEIEGQDLVAWRGLEKSLTIWEYSQIVKAYREGTIIIIDEVTKTRPGARAILNDLMQSKEIELPDGQRVKRGEGFQIIATMNEAKEPYGGYELGEDFEDRFGAILEVRELPKEKRVEFLKRTAIVPLKTGIQKKGNGELDSSFSLTTLGTGRGNDEPLQSTVPEEFIKELVEMQERINASGKVWRKMSLRVLERIIEAIQKYPDEDIGEIIRAEYRIGDWEGGREFVEKEIQALTKKEWVEKDWKKGTPLTGPTGSVQSFTWSNDGTTLFSIGDNGEIFYWKYKNGNIVKNQGTPLTGPTGSVQSFTWSNDGTTLFSIGDTNKIFYWKYENGNIVNKKGTPLTGPTQNVWDFTWSNDGTTLFSRGIGEIFYWKYENGIIVKNQGTPLTGPTRSVWYFTWSNDGTTLFSIGDNNEIFYWKYENGIIVNNQGTRLTSPTQRVEGFTWSNDGTTLFSRGDHGKIFYWKYENGIIVKNQGTPLIGPTQRVQGFTWSNDGTTLFSTGDNNEIFYWKYENGIIVKNQGTPLIGPTTNLKDFIWSNDGTTLFSRGGVGDIFYWKYENGIIVKNQGTRLTSPTQRVEGFTWSNDGTTLFSRGIGEIFYWKYENGNIVKNQGTPLTGPTRNVQGFTWSNDGTTLFSIGDNGEIFYWKYENGNIVKNQGTPLTGPTRNVEGFTWSNDGTTLFSIGDTNEIFYWKLPQPKSGVLERAKAQAKSIPYSPPQIIENGLISDEVRIPIGSDTDYPGTEYEYAPKETPTNNKIIHQILLGISLGRNVLVIGPVGTGKSWLTKAVFRMLHRKVEHMSLHEGTTTRDLTCWPKTKSENNNDGSHSISTDYELSPLARAMLEGRPFIADEVNRATPGVLAVLNHALQFKELILPREIELTLPDGRKILTNRIKAKQGFSLVMTMNPPGGRVEVNDMMADFMDRMYGVEIGYLPEEEEVDLLMRIAGKGNEILRKDIETLVSYANNMRKTSLKKPSFRALERIVESIKHYPNQDPIELLEQKMGMALRPKAERESLAVALLAKEFGKTFKKVVPIAKNVALRAVTKIGAVAALSMNLATGNKDEDGEEKYNPERWWEVGNPSLQDQGRARERRRVLERVMQITTGLGIPLKAWYPIPEAGELGMMRTWRCIWNTKDMKPREMNFVAEDMIQPGSEESVLGVLYHELFELLYRHPEASSSEFLSKLGAALLDNGVGDIWINLKGIEDFVGSRNWLMARYDETYSPTRYGKSLEEHQILMAQQPLYFQFTLGVIYEWVYGKKDPTILNQQVLDAIETLQDRAKEVYLTKEVAEHKKKMEELYDTEEFQALVQKSIEDKAQSKAIAGGKGGEGKEAGDRIPWEKLSDQEKKELLQQLKKAWDSLSPEEKLELLKQAKQELGEKDKNRPEIAPPLMVGEDGNPLDKDKLKEAIQSLKESIERAQEEQDRYDEEQEQKRLEEEEEAAKRDKEERDREGITEKEQADYNARYERVQTDVNRMKTVFRKFYQRQVGYWQRWREKGMLDDAALPLAVAGEDLIFKQRKIPKQYKVRISLLIDQSGSMDGAKIEAAADAVLMMLLAIQEDQKKGIILEVVGFHDNLPMEFYFKYGEKLNKQKVVEVMSKVAKTYLGNNDLRAMYHAFKRIPLKEKNTLNLVIHFSDGDPNFQFSRDRFRKWINSKPHIVVVGLGIGKGAELILDLYHKGQGVWAESTRDVPAKMQQVLERFIGRHGRNGPETIRYSADDIAESETKAHTRTQFLAEFRNGGIPASIFYPYYLKGRIRNPSHLGERFHNLLYWLGEPKVVAPIWEETLFRVLPIILISSLGFNTQELLYTSSLLGWMTFGFALSHIMVRWVIRANDQNWDKGILLWNYKEKEDWPNFIKYLIPALLFSLIYIVSLNFLPLPSSILNHLVPYFIVVLAHGLYSAALLKNLLPELLTPSLNSHPKNSNESEKNITKTKEKIENEIELIVKQELSPFSYGSYQINQAAIQAESNTKQFPLHLIDFPEDMAIEEDGFDLPQKYQDWILGLVKFISLHSSSENNRNPKIGFIVQSNQAKRIIQTMLLELEIPEEMVLFTVQTPEQAVNLAIEKNASIVTLFTDRPENEYWKQTVKWAITLSSGDELKVRGKELKILKNMLQGKLSGKNGKILFKDNELILQKETLGLELNKTEEYHRQTLHFKFQA